MLYVLLPFMLCAPCPFYAPFVFCAFQLLHSAFFYTPESPSTSPNLFSILHFYSLCAMSHLCTIPLRVLCLIIIATLQLLYRLNPCIHHHWVLCRDSLASLVVETIRLLCHSWAHSLCCNSRLQRSTSVNSLYEQSSCHWKIPRDSSSSLAITLKYLWFLWQKPSVVSSSYTVNLLILIPLAPFTFRFTCGLRRWPHACSEGAFVTRISWIWGWGISTLQVAISEMELGYTRSFLHLP